MKHDRSHCRDPVHHARARHLLRTIAAAVVQEYTGQPVQKALLRRVLRATSAYTKPLFALIDPTAAAVQGTAIDPLVRVCALAPTQNEINARIVAYARLYHRSSPIPMEGLRTLAHKYAYVTTGVTMLLDEGYLVRNQQGRLILGPRGQTTELYVPSEVSSSIETREKISHAFITSAQTQRRET